MQYSKLDMKMLEDNAVSIAEANKKYAEMVTVDTSKLVYADGSPLDLLNTKTVKKWLRDMYQNTTVTIVDDGQIVEFTTRGFESDQKRKVDRRAQRRAYANLDDIVESSIFFSYEPGDARHDYVDVQKKYYGLIDINGKYYGTRLKVDIHKGKNVGYYKDLDVAKIKSPSLLHGGSRKSDPLTHQEEGDVLLIPIPEIVRAFGSIK